MSHRTAVVTLGRELHNRLVARQSDAELRRKAKKAASRNFVTWEDEDWREREFAIWYREWHAKHDAEIDRMAAEWQGTGGR